MIRLRLLVFLLPALALAFSSVRATGESPQAAEVRVGSKSFTENVILGEIVDRLAVHVGSPSTHRRGLGGTRLLWNSLLAGEIDIYPEYTGTITEEILAGKTIAGDEALRAAIAASGVRMSRPLGFKNNYALGMLEERADPLGIRKISDLRSHPALAFRMSNEFMDRQDGWPSLRASYRLPQQDVRGVDHDLAYRGLAGGSVDVIDLYTTDAEIAYYGLRTLRDDLDHFPAYEAVLLYRDDLLERHPRLVESLGLIEGRIDAAAMIKMNARAKIERIPENQVAAEFLAERLDVSVATESVTAWQRFVQHTAEHLTLVGISLAAAIAVSIPLGILAAKSRAAGQAILAVVGIVQTIPALALLVFMIPLLGIGGPPAVVALFLYSLLPIVRNTYTGLSEIPSPLAESARALGLPATARLRLVELPLAAPAILAGIKTSAVINIGAATLGALIGAGGYGQPILTGIRLDDMGLILQGAVPAAGLALLVQGGFDVAERFLVPRGLRL